jgi:hypothetical protein
MANIEPYINEIQTARYGEEVRGSIVNALLKVNDDNESYIGMKEEIEDIRDAMTFYRLITLNAAGWDENFEQIKVIDGILADESKQVIEVVPSKTHLDVYLDCKVTCINQGENSLTFKAIGSIPSIDLGVFVFVRHIAGTHIDEELDRNSINPVQNKVIEEKIRYLNNNKFDRNGDTMQSKFYWAPDALSEVEVSEYTDDLLVLVKTDDWSTGKAISGNLRVGYSATSGTANVADSAKSLTAQISTVHAEPVISFNYNNVSYVSYTSGITARGDDRVDFISRNNGQSCKLFAGSFNQYSSKHLKKNIKSMTKKEAEKLLELRPVSFDYKNGDKNQRGLVAEEVQEIYPEMVIAPDGYTEFKEDEPWNALSIDYARFVPALIKMIQIQDERITALEKALKEVTK